jgi:hypothetical protein
MSGPAFVEAQLNGLFRPDFVADGPVTGRLGDPFEGALGLEATRPTRIHDARQLQARDGEAEARFFEDHGFVLLPHESAVEDWEVDPATPDPDCDVVRLYFLEIEALIRSRLLPGRRLEIYQAPLLRRGPGTANPFYGAGVHQDYGLTADDYEESLEAFTTPEIARGWRSRYEQDDVVGFMAINFWRPVYLDGPLHHMPLGVCEPHSVRVEDCVPMGLLEFTPTGKPTNQLALRLNPEQAWYYYPGMTSSEVLAFKNFQCLKSMSEPSVESCFHSAFEEPGAPPGIEERQSCEHRVSVFLLNG